LPIDPDVETSKPEPVIWCFNAQWCEKEAKSLAPQGLVESRNVDRRRTDETFIHLYQLDSDTFTVRHRQKFVKNDNPLLLNERLTTQQGVFLCPADLRFSFVDNLKAMNASDSKDNILKLSLKLDRGEAIKFALNLKNMNLGFAALFPGLDGFARSIGQHIIHYSLLAEGRAGRAL